MFQFLEAEVGRHNGPEQLGVRFTTFRMWVSDRVWHQLQSFKWLEMFVFRTPWRPRTSLRLGTTVTVGSCQTFHSHSGPVQKEIPFTIFQVWVWVRQRLQQQISRCLEMSTCQTLSQSQMFMWLIHSMYLVQWLPMLQMPPSFLTPSQSRTSTHNISTFLRIRHSLETSVCTGMPTCQVVWVPQGITVTVDSCRTYHRVDLHNHCRTWLCLIQ